MTERSDTDEHSVAMRPEALSERGARNGDDVASNAAAVVDAAETKMAGPHLSILLRSCKEAP